MINYTCAQCQMVLQTSEAMAGQQERCPCGHVNTVTPAPAMGAAMPAGVPPMPQPGAMAMPMNYASGPTSFAGFWIRFVAAFLDGLIVSVAMLPFYLIYIAVVYAAVDSRRGPSPGMMIVPCLMWIVMLVGPWLYSALMEASAKQATLGKLALGIKVTDEFGQRIGFGRATGRHFGKWISGIFYIGFIMAAFTSRKQGLHDIMAGCLVISK